MKNPYIGPLSANDLKWMFDQLTVLGFDWCRYQSLADTYRNLTHPNSGDSLPRIWYHVDAPIIDKSLRGCFGPPFGHESMFLVNSPQHFVRYVRRMLANDKPF